MAAKGTHKSLIENVVFCTDDPKEGYLLPFSSLANRQKGWVKPS